MSTTVLVVLIVAAYFGIGLMLGWATGRRLRQHRGDH